MFIVVAPNKVSNSSYTKMFLTNKWLVPKYEKGTQQRFLKPADKDTRKTIKPISVAFGVGAPVTYKD